MKTEDLIRALGNDLAAARSHPAWSAERVLALATLGAGLLVTLLIVLTLPLSPHLGHGPSFTLLMSAAAGFGLAVLGFRAAARSMRPDLSASLWPLAAPALIMAAGVAVELALLSPETWTRRLVGENPAGCFALVSGLSLPVLGAALLALRSGAPQEPARAGLAAGLLAGGLTSALYLLHCPEDSLLFMAAWHVPAVLLVSGLGAWLGRLCLRW